MNAIIESLLPTFEKMAWRLWNKDIPCIGPDDLQSEMVLAALLTLPKIPQGYNKAGYLVVVARYAVIDLYKQNGRGALSLERELTDDGFSLLDTLEASSTPPENALLSPEMAKMLDQIAPQYQQVIQERHHFENWTPAPNSSKTPYTYADALTGFRQKHKIKGPGRKKRVLEHA